MDRISRLITSPAGWLIGIILVLFITYLVHMNWLVWDIWGIKNIDSEQAASLKNRFWVEILLLLILLLVSSGIILLCYFKPNMHIGLVVTLLIAYLVVFYKIYSHEVGYMHRGVNKQEENISLTE